ncbi:MAG TPA: hypothetical protein VK155_06570 [Bacteroidales bacterium]|jgi:hypothetical protein|nr:hypothetical protein [Bacteroidales bacterium]
MHNAIYYLKKIWSDRKLRILVITSLLIFKVALMLTIFSLSH